MSDEVDNQATEDAGALSQEQLKEVLATETEPSEAEAEAKAKTETEAEEPEAEGQQEKPDTEETEAEGEDEEGDKPKKRPSGSERLKRQLAAAKAELDSLRSRSSDGAPSAGEVEKLVGKPPKEEEFNGDFLAYERAQTVYEMRKANAEDRVRERREQADNARQLAKREAAEAHLERVEEFRSKVPEFDTAMKSASSLKAAPHVEELIIDSDKSAHLLYHLAKNPDRLARLNDMSEREAAREIGRIEARLSLPNPKKQTTAPKPINQPKGGAAPASHDADLDSYIKRTYG